MPHGFAPAVFLSLLLAFGAAASAQQAPAPSPGTAPLPQTAKERLGAKWTDEQRVNDCKVPPDKRGTSTRPDRCAHAPSS